MHFTYYVLSAESCNTRGATETNGFSTRDVAIIGVKNSRSRSLFFRVTRESSSPHARLALPTTFLCRASRERKRKRDKERVSGAADNVGACESAAYLLRRFRVTRFALYVARKTSQSAVIRFRAPSSRERRTELRRVRDTSTRNASATARDARAKKT